jgi:hypothetical protein
MSKKLTREQVAARKDKAVRFLSDVLDDSERAAEVEAESVEDYAARKHFVLSNSRGKEVIGMPRREQLTDVQGDRDELLDKLEDVRDELDDILGEYESEEPEEDNAED